MAEFGILNFPVLMGPKRAPVWPPSVVGSITHAAGFCGAVVAPSHQYRGIGIDVEEHGRLDPEMERLICTPCERSWLEQQESKYRGLASTLIFSAKEAFYKCQFCFTQSWLGFRDVQVELGEGVFDITVVASMRPAALRGRPYRGRFSVIREHVYTGIAIE